MVSGKRPVEGGGRKPGQLRTTPRRPRPAVQLSANSRSTSPVRGLGPNEVDFRGTIAPCAATSYTSAADIGAHSTATAPGVACAARTAATGLFSLSLVKLRSAHEDWMPAYMEAPAGA